MKVLLEMRPALDGHAGIPQETRLLFRALRAMPGVEAQGLLQSSGGVLERGLPPGGDELPASRRIHRLSRAVISIQRSPGHRWFERLGSKLANRTLPLSMLARHAAGLPHPLWRFESRHFRDFVWRALFAKTLPFDDFEAVTGADFRILRTPWTAMHHFGLSMRAYPKVDTREFDVVISQTPFPGRVSPRSRLVVRYHDAIPVLMPHTVSDKSFHQASHYHALRENVRRGAHFACVSEATRSDLLAMFPEAEPRSVVIHNMVSRHYFREDSSPARIGEILTTRAGPEGPKPRAVEPSPDYLLMVSTIEPRKNHLALLSAWEQLRSQGHPDLKLVLVGMLGWDHEPIVRKFRRWQERGQLFMLEDVPSPELRLLYRHARATVCPSFGEGFDFAGVEAMRCGGVVAASDIPVHREVYREAAEYFNPYSPAEAAAAIARLVGSSTARREALLGAGERVSALYAADRIIPQWQEFLSPDTHEDRQRRHQHVQPGRVPA